MSFLREVLELLSNGTGLGFGVFPPVGRGAGAEFGAEFGLVIRIDSRNAGLCRIESGLNVELN